MRCIQQDVFELPALSLFDSATRDEVIEETREKPRIGSATIRVLDHDVAERSGPITIAAKGLRLISSRSPYGFGHELERRYRPWQLP